VVNTNKGGAIDENRANLQASSMIKSELIERISSQSPHLFQRDVGRDPPGIVFRQQGLAYFLIIYPLTFMPRGGGSSPVFLCQCLDRLRHCLRLKDTLRSNRRHCLMLTMPSGRRIAM
jgi:hypothetical protein